MFKADLVAPLGDLLARHSRERGQKIAYRDAQGEVSYADLAHRTASLASGLAALSVSPGDHVAMLLPNGVAWAETCIAIVRAGAIAVPIGIDSTMPEIGYRLSDSGCVAVVTIDALAPVVTDLKQATPSLRHIISIGGEIAGTHCFAKLASGAADPEFKDCTDIDQASFLIYTSGTTGQPKGVRLSCRSMLWVTAACWAPIVGLNEDDVILAALPLFHSYALNLCVLSVLATGATIHLMNRYSTSEALALLSTGQFTLFPGVPTMFHYLMESCVEGVPAGIPALRACISAGAILPAAQGRAFEAQFGVPLLDGYGITETSTMVTMNPASGPRPPGSCGLGLPGLGVRIVDPATSRDCDPGEEGELIVRGPNVMLGYHNKPDETERALRGGWYHSGDLARADRNGFLTITGRIKELIIRGGQNIAPAEIEEVVLKLDTVLDCAVVGLPHDGLGEVPGLFVIPRSEDVDAALILTHCRTHLSSYKVPAVIEVVPEIPRTGSGKIIRFRLRDAYMARMSTAARSSDRVA